jgi:NAD(P)-dependent dehydrogenase (short-subunit alcohol dehydrogenase family)
VNRSCKAALVVAFAWTCSMPLFAAAPHPTVLITGASRGIGLEFARQYAAQGWRVIATARNPASASELQKLAAADPDVTVEALDVTNHAAVDALAVKYKDQPVDLLLLNAAQGPATAEAAVRNLAKLDFEEARQSFEVNAIGPMKVTQAFLGSVAASDRKLIIAISSDSASLEASVRKPLLYHYRASKAALNMYMHTLSFEAPRKGITVVMLHPGTVKTNPGLMNLPGAMETPDSVTRMAAVIARLTPADNGRFIDYRGETMPW